jgi:ABC-type multidrug transport system ATPase subunit
MLRDLADESCTVLISSHLMSEMEDTADHLVVLGRDRFLADVPWTNSWGRTRPSGCAVRVHRCWPPP